MSQDEIAARLSQIDEVMHLGETIFKWIKGLVVGAVVATVAWVTLIARVDRIDHYGTEYGSGLRDKYDSTLKAHEQVMNGLQQVQNGLVQRMDFMNQEVQDLRHK